MTHEILHRFGAHVTERAEQTRRAQRLAKAIGTRRKTPGPVPRQQPPAAIEREFGRKLSALVDAGVRTAFAPLLAQLPALVESASRERAAALGVRADAGEARAIRELVARARAAMAESIAPSAIEALSTAAATGTSTLNREQLRRQVLSALGIDVLASDERLPPLVEAFNEANVGLIRGLTDKIAADVEALVLGGLSSGTLHGDLAEQLEAKIGFGKKRSKLIARDQVGKLYGQINAARQRDLGVTRFVWRSANDRRVRGKPGGAYPNARPSHWHRDGKTYEYAKPPDGELPGEAILCFPGDTHVGSDAPVVKLYRRWYRGEGTAITTHNGRRLASTPNHPVLTQRGWLPAHLVDVGDYVVETPAQRLNIAVTDGHHGQTAIEQVFRSLQPFGIAQRRRGLTGWFHGDTTGDDDVDVVDVDWHLDIEGMSALSQRGCQQVLTLADQSTAARSPTELCFGRFRPAAASFVRGGGKALAIIGAGLAHARDHGAAAVAWLDTVAHELRANGCARDAELLRDLLDACSGREQSGHLIARVVSGVVRRAVDPAARLDTASAKDLAQAISIDAEQRRDLGDRVAGQQLRRVVEKRSCVLAGGHVYNLGTLSGWYVAQSLIVHNCRCTAEPVLEDLIDDGPAAAPAPEPARRQPRASVPSGFERGTALPARAPIVRGAPERETAKPGTGYVVRPSEIAPRVAALPGGGADAERLARVRRGYADPEVRFGPIRVVALPDGRFEVIDGRHRFIVAAETDREVLIQVERGSGNGGALVPLLR